MLSILRKARLKDKEMRILMLGLDNAGKTTIVKRIMNEDVNTVSPTLGFIIKTIEYDGYKLNIWDVGGQKTLRTYWKNYFEKTDTLIWVVDATDRERIDDCRQELAGLLQEERLSGASLLVFKNKSDVSGAMSEDDVRKVGNRWRRCKWFVHQPILMRLSLRASDWTQSRHTSGTLCRAAP
ncbi:ADP-ribosylation factor-like protein 2, variant 2 [Plenodomus lindquistii]|nr:ADP-ribosylation factor-like protein 2, variant 2 [Plenodomus lindquistii]